MNETLKINDIKELMDIPDNSFIFFIALCIFGIFIFIAIVFLIIKFFKNKNKNQKKIYYEELRNLDYTHSKNAAYKATTYLRILAKSEKEKEFIKDLIEDINQYKYKKQVDKFDDKLKAKIENFMDMCDV